MNKSLSEMREAVFAAKPVFAQVIRTHGGETLQEYFAKLPIPVAVLSERKKEFLSVFEDMLGGLVGEDAARVAVNDLAASWYVSTADHHGPLTHPFFFNSAIMHSYAAQAAGRKSVIALSCGGISIDNSSFPRGFLMHDETGKEIRLHLIDRTKSNQPVYSRASFGASELLKLEREIMQLGTEAARVREALLPPLNEALGLPSYSSQMTRFNHRFWKQVPGQQETNLIYLEQESLVRELILRNHLDSETFVRSLLSDAAIQESIETHFSGIMGAFDTTKGKGTFLFWGIENGRRIALSRGDSRMGSIDAIREGLQSGSLMPSMLLSFIVISFYYGITCGGGFSQVNYLTDMKTAFINLLSEHQLLDQFPHLADLETGFFCSDFSFLNVPGSAIPATPLESIARSQTFSQAMILSGAGEVTLADAVDALIPELYL